jgi:hypothetical protein
VETGRKTVKMQLKPEQTPRQFKSIKCILNPDSNIRVFRNVDAGDEVFFHVSDQPPIEEISSPDDIETLAAFQVGSDETEDEVREQAVQKAQELDKKY